jgi:hypothetical protein
MNFALLSQNTKAMGRGDLFGGLPGGLVCGMTPAWELVLGAREEGDMGVSVSRIKRGEVGEFLIG